MKVTNKSYIKELEDMKKRMLGAEILAKKLPYFSETILKLKISGDGAVNLGKEYKDMYLNWGINKCHYSLETPITNYEGDVHKWLYRIYINTLDLYDSHINYGLECVGKTTSFFYDRPNTTFYIKEENLIEFLDELNEWYRVARDKEMARQGEKQIEKLEKELAKLKELR